MLINKFTLSLYSNVCRSIFEKDKLLFSFLLTVKIREFQGLIKNVQFKLFIEKVEGIQNCQNLENLCKSWLPNVVWNKFCYYAQQDCAFSSLMRNFTQDEEVWQRLY